MDTYHICTTTAIISSRFQALDLLDLSNCNFRDLRDVDSSTLPTMTFIQACKAYVKTNLITPTDACNCMALVQQRNVVVGEPKYNVALNVIHQKRNHVQMSSLIYVFLKYKSNKSL
jgi:hypothetical protein